VADLVEIAPFDPGWPAAFDAERALLEPVLAPWLTGEIHHVGSTSVPGLGAKPVIDILAEVASLEVSRAAIEPLQELSYWWFPYQEERMNWFCKPSPEHRTHHLHLVVPALHVDLHQMLVGVKRIRSSRRVPRATASARAARPVSRSSAAVALVPRLKAA